MKGFMLSGRRLFILMLSALLTSCSSLPLIRPGDSAVLDVQRCARPFPDTPYRFVHAIEATLPGGGAGTVLGVTVVDPAAKAIRSAMMTIEGFLLFEAQYEKEVHVQRAVPPFDGVNFAEHMMEVIRLIFLPPDGRLMDTGRLEDGSTICRYAVKQEEIEDVIVHRNDTWEIGTYRNPYERLGKISAFSLQEGIPGMLEITAFASGYYSLSLKLISAEPVSPEATQLPYEAPPDNR